MDPPFFLDYGLKLLLPEFIIFYFDYIAESGTIELIKPQQLHDIQTDIFLKNNPLSSDRKESDMAMIKDFLTRRARIPDRLPLPLENFLRSQDDRRFPGRLAAERTEIFQGFDYLLPFGHFQG